MKRDMEELKYRLCDELSEYAEKSRWTERDVEMIDRITHSIKSLMKYLEMEEYGGEASYRNGNSYMRGRSSRNGDYSRNYGRYYDDRSYDGGSYRGRSYDDGLDVEELEEMMNSTSDTDIKEAMKKTIAYIKKANK